MVDKAILGGRKLKAALNNIAEVGPHSRKNRFEDSPTKRRKLVHIGMYFITLMLLLVFLLMC